MTRNISRAQFLRGDLSGHHSPARPPWSISEYEFVSLCSQCGDCITACPENILKPGRGKYPQVNFAQGECTFCGECVAHCTTGALTSETLTSPVQSQKLPPWSVRAFISNECLVLKKVLCQTCSEHCEQSAIRFRFEAGGPSRPELNLENCNGCGACYSPCPANAITLRQL